jgi:hypothetical protein
MSIAIENTRFNATGAAPTALAAVKQRIATQPATASKRNRRSADARRIDLPTGESTLTMQSSLAEARGSYPIR